MSPSAFRPSLLALAFTLFGSSAAGAAAPAASNAPHPAAAVGADQSPAAKLSARSHALGLTPRSLDRLVAAARFRHVPSALSAAERARLAQVVEAYRRGDDKKAAGQLRALSSSYAKHHASGLESIANHLTWAVVVEPDPDLRHIVVGTLYLGRKREALAQQTTYLSGQLELATGKTSVAVSTLTMSKATDGSLLISSATQTMDRPAIKAELTRVLTELDKTTISLAAVEKVVADSELSAPGTDSAHDQAIAALDADIEYLMMLLAKLTVTGGDTSSDLAQLLAVKREKAEAYLAKCQQGDQAACKDYYALLEEIADLEASLAK